MIAGNHDSFLHAGTCQVGQLSRQHGEAETPTFNQPPRGAQGRRLLGPAALRTCPFTSLVSQVRAHLEPGGYCRRSRNGGPQTCLPTACGMAQVQAQCGPSSSTQTQDPREGPSLAGQTMQGFPQEQPCQEGSPGRVWLSSAQARPRSSPQAPRDSCCGSSWSRWWFFAR